MRFWTTGLALAGLLLPMTAAAQAPEGGAKARPVPRGEPGAAEPGELRLRAESQEKLGEGHYQARGFVDLTAGEVRIQADLLDLYVTDLPGGGKSRKIVAEGNVVFMRGEERLSGERLTMDMDSGQGVFEEALGYVQPGVFVEGRTIERLSADTYRVEGAKFTSCAQPNPRWGFSASSAKIHVDDKITARNVLFKVKEVPAFYVPYLMYPIREDQRATGFLLPHFGYSSSLGFDKGVGFFWAMGRSFDQTFYADQYSKFGYGLGHEFRYTLASPSHGTFRTYGFRPQGGGKWDYDLDWNALQALPWKLRATALVRQYSDVLFQQRLQNSVNRASTRSQTSSFSLQRSFGATSVQALADSTETLFGRQTQVRRHLPSLLVRQSPKKIGSSGIAFNYEVRAESLGRGNKQKVDRFSRIDLNPELSRPIGFPFLQITPRIEGRYTRYGATLVGGKLADAPLERRFFEAGLELRGPTFARVFNNPSGFYSDKFKHVIGPEVTFRYRTAVEDFKKIPRVDAAVDQFLGTNQVEYALVQRLFAKRPGFGGKSVPYEFFSWRLAQTYYVQVANGQREFDPNFSSAAFFDPLGRRTHNSPVQSQMKLQPTPRFRTSFDLDYDVNFKKLRRLSLSTQLSGSRGSFQVGWSKSTRLLPATDPATEPAPTTVVTPLQNTVRASGRLEALPNKVRLEGSVDYDFARRALVQARGQFRYDVQCCGFMVEAIRGTFNAPKEWRLSFSIELANIGAIGNFNGEDRGRVNSPGLGVFK